MARMTSLGAAVAALIASQAPAAAPRHPAAAQTRISSCDLRSIERAFAGDPLTRVTLVKAFAKGDELNLTGKPSGKLAANDICMVKLLVGPGHPGPADAPSTSQGIAIEVWLPTPANWNGRIHNIGGSVYAGDPTMGSLTELNGQGGRELPLRADVAGVEGAVSAGTDTGHVGRDGSWAMNPDGSFNVTLWRDFSSRGLHEMAVKTKALTAAYYGRAARYAYFDGCSQGGRQGHKSAQAFPGDYDGILAGNPGIDWTSFLPGMLYPQLVFQRDLGGVPISPQALQLVSSAAISACDTDLNGQHEGYINDPASCRYDPTRDPKVLCKADGGQNETAQCVTRRQAQAINKIWYGQTVDGQVPDPQAGNGYAPVLGPGQLWFGYARGADLLRAANSTNGVPDPPSVATHHLALISGKSAMATPDFVNATGNGADGWKALSYADLARAGRQGRASQGLWDQIDTDRVDLERFRARGGRMLAYGGMADNQIPFQSALRYYDGVAARMGGHAAVQKFYQLYPIPGMGHCFGTSVNGMAGVSPPADPPLPRRGQLYEQLVAWVEQGRAPRITLQNASGSVKRPLCAYPKKLKYLGGDRAKETSYACA